MELFDINKLITENIENPNSETLAKMLYCSVKDTIILTNYNEILCFYNDKWNCHKNMFELAKKYIEILLSFFHDFININNIDVKLSNKLQFYLNNSKNKKEIFYIFTKMFKVSEVYEKFDTQNRKIIGFNNICYDFDKCCFRQGLQSDLILNRCTYDYLKSTRHEQETLEKIMLDIFSDKTNLNIFLDSVLKMITTSYSNNNVHQCLILTGSEFCGKTTIIELLLTTLESMCKLINNKIIFSPDCHPKARVLYSKELVYKKHRILITDNNTNDTSLIEYINWVFNQNNTLDLQNIIILSNEMLNLDMIKPSIKKTTNFEIINLPNKFVENPKLSNQNEKQQDLDILCAMPQLKCAFIDMLIERHKNNKLIQGNLIVMEGKTILII